MFQKLAAAKGLSLSEVARECSMAKSTLSRVVRDGEPKAADLLALATYFGVTMEYLYQGDLARDCSALHVQEEKVEYVAERRAALEEILRQTEELVESTARILGEGREG